MRTSRFAGMVLLLICSSPVRADDLPAPVIFDKDVRGLATRTSGPVTFDGKLTEWAGAFAVPVNYNHAKLDERAAQFFSMWDEHALYIGLRALDRHRANVGGKGSLWNGDAVEFYLDTRPGAALLSKDWSAGAVHLFYTAFEDAAVRPRWEVRQGIATSSVILNGVEIAATAHEWGYEIEFAIPWANFPDFAPREGAVLALDAELCSGDGGGRVDRTFAYGSPLSVQQPASQGKIGLVSCKDPGYRTCREAACPMWVETPWVQPERAKCRAVIAIPPALIGTVEGVEVRLHDADGAVVRTLPAPVAQFGPAGLGFARAVAEWPIDDFAPGSYFATARVKTQGPIGVSVAPRMVQEAQMSGR